jgi:ABC-type uncharacterized transport system substrate-binding protein
MKTLKLNQVRIVSFAAIVILVACNTNAPVKKTIVYVNSYHAEHPPSAEVTTGVLDNLPADSFRVHTFFMDTKRNTSISWIEQKAAQLMDTIQKIEPDVLIVSDDNAVKYLVEPYQDQFDFPVVFCGVNWTADAYKLPEGRYTGIIEILPVDRAVEIMQDHFPGIKSMAVINENTTTSRKTEPLLASLLEAQGIELEQMLVDDFSQWKEAFERSSNEFDLIYLQTQGAIRNWDPEEAREYIQEHLNVPTLTCEDHMMPFVLFGLTQVSQEQGEWASEAAKRILAGEEPATIPVTRNQRFRAWINPYWAKVMDFNMDSARIDSLKIYLDEGASPGH